MKILYILFLLIPLKVYSQDTSTFTFSVNPNNLGFDKNVTWVIDGKELNYQNQSIRIKPKNTGFDTILYKNEYLKDFRIIICQIPENQNFQFVTNPCCGGFNVLDLKSGKATQSEISILIKDTNTNKKWLGIYGNTATIIKSNVECKLSQVCKSAMSSNICHISIQAVEKCEQDDCNNLLCLVDPDISTTDFEYDYEYQLYSEFMSIYYLPFNFEPVRIVYQMESNEIKLNNIKME